MKWEFAIFRRNPHDALMIAVHINRSVSNFYFQWRSSITVQSEYGLSLFADCYIPRLGHFCGVRTPLGCSCGGSYGQTTTLGTRVHINHTKELHLT
jgi:hypothetical protein